MTLKVEEGKFYSTPFSKEDPFEGLKTRKVIKKLIKDLDENREGTYFQKCDIAKKEASFLKVYEGIPDDLKDSYLLIRDNLGNTIVHQFAKYGKTQLIQEIFKNFTTEQRVKCICFQNNEGDTPLHFATAYGKDQAGPELLSYLDGPSRYKSMQRTNNKEEKPLDIKNTRKNDL